MAMNYSGYCEIVITISAEVSSLLIENVWMEGSVFR